MKEDILVQISNKIKQKRRERNITIQELADRAGVSKGLVSQIENSRTVPSLMVLIDIVRGLDIDLNVFFKDLHTARSRQVVLIKRASEYEDFEKEDAKGFLYQRIFTQSIGKGTIDIVLLRLEPAAQRPIVVTQAYEYNYIISGQVSYRIGEEVINLEEGDSMLFDGRLPHTPTNAGQTIAEMLVIYFFESQDA
ncbi:helix-turn-helix domain-containing protein [Pedobacter sp. SYP-B3415]|uniref:helix-turn-helix domain-containing protein n=1 Tax=Pedobacter sp. SYP-B3415 TaxID=2496641 RepID=UPI00101E05EC|nr:XRE family transcriptional regulator [Pedobacter sp. SYP-B3415]